MGYNASVLSPATALYPLIGGTPAGVALPGMTILWSMMKRKKINAL